VLHQAQQRGPGRHQRAARLLLGQAVRAATEGASVFVQERLELGLGRQVDDVFGERRGQRGTGEASQEDRPWVKADGRARGPGVMLK